MCDVSHALLCDLIAARRTSTSGMGWQHVWKRGREGLDMVALGWTELRVLPAARHDEQHTQADRCHIVAPLKSSTTMAIQVNAIPKMTARAVLWLRLPMQGVCSLLCESAVGCVRLRQLAAMESCTCVRGEGSQHGGIYQTGACVQLWALPCRCRS